MVKKNMLKRGTSLAMSVVLAVGLLGGAVPNLFPTEKAEAATIVTYLPKKLGAAVLPMSAVDNSDFMRNYVSNGGSMSINSLFKLTNWYNINDDVKKSTGRALNKSDKLMHEDNKKWNITYQWKFSGSQSELKTLMNEGQLKLTYTGNMYSDKHSNFIGHWKKKWDRSYLYIAGLKSDGYTKFLEQTSESRNDEGAQSYTLTKQTDSSWSNYTGLEFYARSVDCNCGSSAVAQSVMYLTDTTAPYVTSVYVAYDEDGNDKISYGTGLKANDVGYIIMNFNENIRFANHTSESFELSLDAFYKDNDQSAGNVKASLIRLEGNKMVFKFTVPEKIGGKDANIYVNAISQMSKQSWMSSSNQFDYVVLDGNGNKVSVKSGIDMKTTSKITDLAGNALNWNDSNKSINKIYMDGVYPEFKKVELAGNMINNKSQEADNSAVFVGPGDVLKFSVYFSEELLISDAQKNNIKAKLNVSDASGNPVILTVKRIRTTSAKSVFGVDAASSNVTYLEFSDFTVGAGMQPTAVDGKPIQIVEIVGMDNITDVSGNVLKPVNEALTAPAQKEYLDTLKPGASTTLVLPQGKDVYTPIDGGIGFFTFPISVNDDASLGTNGDYVSGTQGKMGSFSLIMDGDSKEFGWYIDTNQELAENPKWNVGKTASDITKAESYKMPQLESPNVSYIHIKLHDDVVYDEDVTDGVSIDATLHIATEDYAGNTSTNTFSMTHNPERQKPVAQMLAKSFDIDYEAYTATMTAKYKVSDNYGIKSMSYYLGEEGSEVFEVSLGSEVVTEKEIDIPAEITFTNDDSTRIGTVKVTVLAEDYNGNKDVWVHEFDYDFQKAVPNYTVETGSITEPIRMPSFTVNWPYSKDGSYTKARTMMLIPAGTSGDEEVYYAFIHGADSALSGGNVFLTMPESADDTEYYDYQNYWYKLTGKVDGNNGTFTSAEKIVDSENMKIYEIYQYLKQQYGLMEFIFVTSEEVYEGASSDTNYSFTEARSVVERETFYFANNIDFDVTFGEMTDANGNSIEEALKYVDGTDMIPVSSLDDAGLDIQLANAKEPEETIYGFGVLDVNKSYIRLSYKSGNNWIECYTKKLSGLSEQKFSIPQGVAEYTTWYKIDVVVYDCWGNSETFSTGEYFIDTAKLDFGVSSYEKTYRYLGTDGGRENTVRARNEQTLDVNTELTIDLSDVPEHWSLTEDGGVHEILFWHENRGTVTGLTQDVAMKVWSKQDSEGEEHASWIDVTDATSLGYTPVLADEYSADSYSYTDVPVLPLKAGNNVICIQLRNTNGVVETKEMLINVMVSNPEFELNQEKTKLQATITPVVSDAVMLQEPVIENFDARLNATEDTIPVFTATFSGTYRFYLLDKNGALSYRVCEITDVDGDAPYYAGYTTGTNYDDVGVAYNGFHFTYYVNDHGGLPLDETYVTFDADYSALLMGLTGEERANNTEKVTMKLPLNTEQNEDGTYKIWENYNSGFNGIYRTQIVNVDGPEESGGASVSIEVWGVFMYDDSAQQGEWIERTLQFHSFDMNGNQSEMATRTRTYSNDKPKIQVGAVDNDRENGQLMYSEKKFDEDGNLGIFSYTPLSGVYSYGAAPMQLCIDTYYTSGFYTNLPMINADGFYDVTFTDLFGNTYVQELQVDVFGSTDIQFEVSDTEYTNQDVIVTAKALNEGDEITSISADINGTIIDGIIDAQMPEQADIVMTGNGIITVTTKAGKSHTMRVNNIDKTLEKAQIIYDYNGSMEAELAEGSEDTVENVITAVVQCDEDIDGVNGPTSYTFPKGSTKGTEYTFEFKDAAGNIGTLTAVLPYNIQADTEETPEVDITAPVYAIHMHGMRNDSYTYLADFSMPKEENDPGADSITAALGEYVAQKYAMIFDIEDDSATKVVVKQAGAQAPVSYDEKSDDVEGVTLNGTMITISENTSFDVYLVDESGNVTALTGIMIASIDNQAPSVTTEHEIVTNENGVKIARIKFIPANEEFITSWDNEVHTHIEVVGNAEVVRYYRDFNDNESFTFHYKDLYGNSATAVAEVKGMDTEKPSVEVITWYGTENNNDPKLSAPVNRDVSAVLSVNKAVSDVKLYKYDEEASDKKGELLTDLSQVQISITGKEVTLTYSENITYDILVEIFASSNNKATTQKVQAVTCIDKEMPVVTVKETVLADDKRSKTVIFTTDELTLLKENINEHDGILATEHSWTATSSTTEYITFVDEAGNAYQYPVTALVADVDDKKLTLSYSKYADGRDAVSRALDLELQEGDTIYINATKSAEITLNEMQTVVAADTWTAFELAEDAGFQAIVAKDINTGELVYGNLSVEFKDRVAPVINFDSKTIYILEGSSVEAMNEAVREGITITDNVDGNIESYELTGVPAKTDLGLYELSYTAKDSAGNQITAGRLLYIYNSGSPLVKINGEAAAPMGTIVVDTDELKISLNSAESSEYVVKWKAGIKTTGQMKYGATTVTSGTFTVPGTGFYTVYVRTQSRQEFVTYIYVEK